MKNSRQLSNSRNTTLSKENTIASKKMGGNRAMDRWSSPVVPTVDPVTKMIGPAEKKICQIIVAIG